MVNAMTPAAIRRLMARECDAKTLHRAKRNDWIARQALGIWSLAA